MKQDYYVYVYFRHDTAQPCYVGKGRNRRVYDFRRTHNHHLRGIIKNAGGELPFVIIRNGLTEAGAFEIECAFIKAIGRGKDGPLVNLTDGGDGASGHRKSAETREKTKASVTRSHMENPRSDESRAKSSNTHLCRYAEGAPTWNHTPKSKEKLSNARKLLFSQGKISIMHSDETRLKLSGAQRHIFLSGTRKERKISGIAKNECGLIGIHWSDKDKCYAMGVKRGNIRIRKSGFDCPAAAHFSYLVAAHDLYGDDRHWRHWPNTPKIELNARRAREGWSSWGTGVDEQPIEAAE